MVVMHISDLHFGITDASNNRHIENRKKVLETFLENFSSLPENLMPDVLVITGDIGYSGVDSDYQEAKIFIEKLVKNSKNKLSTNDIIICAGNHDVFIPADRRKELRPKKDDENLSGIDALTRRNIQSSTYKFDSFVKFLTEMNIQPFKNEADDEKSKYLYGYRYLKGINFIVLNSEWDFFGKGDRDAQGCLRLGADLVADAFDKMTEWGDDNNPIIAIFHRPINPNIHVSERNIYSNESTNVENTLNCHADLILNGHVHVGNVTGKGIRAWNYSCGTIHSVDTERPEFWIFKFETGCYTTIKYKWNLSPFHRNGIWKEDTDDAYNQKVWRLDDNPDAQNKEIRIVQQLMKAVKEGKITKEEALESIKKNIASFLLPDIIELFNETIREASTYDKKNEKEDVSSRDYEHSLELSLSEIETASTNKDEISKSNVKEEKDTHE